MPTGIRGHARGPRGEFSLRRTAVGFALAACLLVGGGLLLRTAWASAGRHPVGWSALAAVGVGGVALLRRRHRRSSAAQVAAAVTGAAEELVDAALAELDAAAAAELDAEGGAARGPAPEPAAVSGPEYAALDPYAFEEAVADLCRRDGCRDVEVVGGAGDLGADVLATAPDGRRVVVQCKRYGPANKVGSQDLQRFGGTCYAVHGAEAAVVVTTGEFTGPAAEYAAACGIVCVDADGLTGWSEGTLPPPWELPVASGGPGNTPEPVA